MKEGQVSIRVMANLVHELAREKGWYAHNPDDDLFINTACNNLHDEVSELHEAWRNNALLKPCDKADAMAAAGIVPLNCLEEELADIVIRVFDDATYLGVDIESAIIRKHAFNKTRPHRHGGKKG
jgi:NTP pyrophosphatase (non-canonical NTP hydrolase)